MCYMSTAVFKFKSKTKQNKAKKNNNNNKKTENKNKKRQKIKFKKSKNKNQNHKTQQKQFNKKKLGSKDSKVWSIHTYYLLFEMKVTYNFAVSNYYNIFIWNI